MDKKKIYCIAYAIVIVVGIIITCIFGFNVDLVYREHKHVDIMIGKQFDYNEIKELAKEALNDKNIYVEKVELYGDMVSVNAKEITDEQLETLNNKINEKYEIENKTEDLEVITVPKEKISDVIKPYILPVITSAILILVYAVIRYRKLGIINVLLKVSAINVLVQATYFSIYAITRISFDKLTLSGALILLMVSLFITFYKLESEKEKKEQEK